MCFEQQRFVLAKKIFWGLRGTLSPTSAHTQISYIVSNFFGGTYNHAATEYLIFVQKEYIWFREH